MQVAGQPEAVDYAIPQSILRSDSSHSLSDEGSASRAQREREMQRRQSQVAGKLAQKVASMRGGDNGNEVIPKIPEFEELLYIYCQKPSEMKERQERDGPLVAGDRAIMANLSESQLVHLTKRHPDSLIE